MKTFIHGKNRDYMKKKKIKPKRNKSTKAGVPSSDQKTQASEENIAPHFDTASKNSEPNTNVELSEENLTDSFQTDNLPKDR